MISASVLALANVGNPDFPGLESNERYTELKRQNSQLLEKEDSIQGLISLARDEFSRSRDSIVSTAELDRFSTYIIGLEEQVFEIRQQRGDVITELNNMEQAYILEHMYSAAHTHEVTSPEEEILATVDADSTTMEQPVIAGKRNLIDNDIFGEKLSDADYAELRTAEREERAMPALAEEYAATYRDIRSTAAAYLATDNEATADSLYTAFNTLVERNNELNNAMELQWNRILDTKYYAYGYILELRNRYTLLDSSSAAFSEMQQRCSSEDGYYASDALAHYAIGRPTLLDFEIEFAREMGLHEALDSLQSVRQEIVIPEYRLEPIELERRLFLDYQPIIVGRTNYYNSSNPVPELKVYERGTIYRILLGAFRNKQPMTLFKGVQPLYITQNEEGNYCYYAGGFATRLEADEAQIFLKEKGFKRPEICCWHDGEMVNLSTESDEETSSEVVTPAGNRYIVMIECETLSDNIRETITGVAPDKMISRRGNKFAIGTFTERSEADMLLSTLMDRYPKITVTIEVIDL